MFTGSSRPFGACWKGLLSYIVNFEFEQWIGDDYCHAPVIILVTLTQNEQLRQAPAA